MMYLLASNSPCTTVPRPTTNLLSQAELEALDAKFSANADKWLADNAPKAKVKAERKPKANRGPKPNIIQNSFYGFIGCTTYWERYPVFALDIIEGVVRLDWHNRPIGKGGKSILLNLPMAQHGHSSSSPFDTIANSENKPTTAGYTFPHHNQP